MYIHEFFLKNSLETKQQVGKKTPEPEQVFLLTTNTMFACMYLRLVWFYGISTIVGYLMLNHVFTRLIYKYMICKHIL